MLFFQIQPLNTFVKLLEYWPSKNYGRVPTAAHVQVQDGLDKKVKRKKISRLEAEQYMSNLIPALDYSSKFINLDP